MGKSGVVEVRKAADSFFVSDDTGCSLVGEAVGEWLGRVSDTTVSVLLTKTEVKFCCGVKVGP